MPYARLDDRYDDHRKIKRAWRREPAAVALHAMAITYCNRHTSDGVIDAEWIEEKLALLPYKPAQRDAVLGALVELQLFERIAAETYRVHDFLDWNLSKHQRAALAEQGRRGGRSGRGGSSRPDGDGSSPPPSKGSSLGLSEGLTDGLSQSGNGGLSTPTPTPTPTPSHARTTSLRSVGVPAAPAPADQELEETVTFLCSLLSAEVRIAHSIAASSKEALVAKGWPGACRGLLTSDGFTAEQVEFAIRWVCRHHYWRNRVKSMPRLRSEMAAVVADIKKQSQRVAQVVPINGRRESAGDLIDLINANRGEAS